jgi:two-component system sensor histidine kinase/response regulator
VKNLTIAVATPKDIPDEQLIGLGDSMLSYSLFQNLLKNACEAAPEGSTVTCKILPADKWLKVVMENSGSVPLEIRERFFDKFATAGKQGGTGIGTYSAKLLAEAQHGMITMETSDDKNRTCITVSLPAA